MIGFYVHTHWGYNNPYSARTWRLENWEGYLEGLHRLGYDFIQIWPLLDTMPVELTGSDRSFLSRIAKVIDIAHDKYGMTVSILSNTNCIGNEKAGGYPYETRPYFVVERKLNPGDEEHMNLLLQHTRNTFEYLHKADIVSAIDSDPGGWIGSTNDEFVSMMARKVKVIRELNPKIHFDYWMHVGWENYNRFWGEAVEWDDPYSRPKFRFDLEVFSETLKLMKETFPEPWGILCNFENHFKASDGLELGDKRLQFRYGVIEGEPTFPLTNWNPEKMDKNINHPFPNYSRAKSPRGTMGNAQTHCLQLPHTYLFAHMAKGGSIQTADLGEFAGEVLPDCSKTVADAWGVVEGDDPDTQRSLAQKLREESRKEQRTGKYRGLLFGNPARFLEDLAFNLEVRSYLTELRVAVEKGGDAKSAIRNLLIPLRAYQRRLGFVDAYGGPIYDGLNHQVWKLKDPEIDKVCRDFTNWANPALRNGIFPRLLDALEAYSNK